MDITTRTEDGVIVVEVLGNVSGSTDEESELTSMMSDISSRGAKLFVINLDNMVSVDESGMRMLLRVCSSVHRNGCHMVFVRSIAEGTLNKDSSPDKDKLVFESEHRAIEAVKRKSVVV
jgi:anti-anti-sigma factor